MAPLVDCDVAVGVAVAPLPRLDPTPMEDDLAVFSALLPVAVAVAGADEAAGIIALASEPAVLAAAVALAEGRTVELPLAK